jgi:hypothetical protein
MKKLFFLICLAMAVNVHGQEKRNKPVFCGPNQQIFSYITGPEFTEQLYWIGKTESEDSKFALLVNAKTRTWTLIEFNKDTACVLGTGVDYKNLFGTSI